MMKKKHISIQVLAHEIQKMMSENNNVFPDWSGLKSTNN